MLATDVRRYRKSPRQRAGVGLMPALLSVLALTGASFASVFGPDVRDWAAAGAGKFGEVSSITLDVPAAPPLAAFSSTSSSAPSEISFASLGSRWEGEGIVFVATGQEWDAPTLRNVEVALALLPDDVRPMARNRQLGDLHVLVNRHGKTLSGKQPYGRAANFYSTNEGRNELVLYPGQSVLTVLHELGHAYNLRNTPAGGYALVLLEPEMQSFMAATGWHVLSDADVVRTARDHTQVSFLYTGNFRWDSTSNDDPLEDFANAFALYFYDADRLRERSPERFEWFAQHFAR